VTFPDPFFRRRGSGAHHLYGMRRVHEWVSSCAKNTLDVNYLYLARSAGPKFSPRPKSWTFARSTASPTEATVRSSHCKVDCLLQSASAKFHLSQRGVCRVIVGHHGAAFPSEGQRLAAAISNQLGKYVRTNSESLIGVRVPHSKQTCQRVSPSLGCVHRRAHASGSRSLSRAQTPWRAGNHFDWRAPWAGRIGLWLRNLTVALVMHPFRTVRY